ncbi:MAG: type II 3-dehydroquinate dehydratase [Epulopiscium sp. Nuni2H_MBin001]|nr:MAG: type II 3-dehydroquinate dehydratase [Epulopiscium sp. Nuni2H_MBin001]
MHFCIINGVNLNMLGTREPHIYGTETLDDLELMLREHVKDVELTFFQSNIEGEIVNCIHECYHNKIDGIVINPAAFTHYSYAIADAIKGVDIPTIEVHISNIHKREAFRQHSVTASSCIGSISGFGFSGYRLALEHLLYSNRKKDNNK